MPGHRTYSTVFDRGHMATSIPLERETLQQFHGVGARGGDVVTGIPPVLRPLGRTYHLRQRDDDSDLPDLYAHMR